MRVKTIKFVLAMITMLSLLFVMGCKDTVTPSDPLVPQVPAGGGSTENPSGEDGDNNQPETPYPGPQKPSAAIFHDETCTCGGTITLEDYSEGGIVARCTGNHSLDGGAGNAPWKAMVCYTMDAADEGPYVVSFEAKADSVYDSVVNVHNTEENLNLCSYIPISYTTEYKKYNYIVYINDNVRGENTFGFSVNNGKTYIKNLTIENVWHEEAEWNKSEMSAWKIWQDPSCNPLNVGASNAGHISIYEMTKDSVKAIRNTCQMQYPDGWKHQVVYSLPDTSAGKYCMSFTNKSYAEDTNENVNIIGSIEISYYDPVAQETFILKTLTGINNYGKHYFYFDINDKYIEQPLKASFWANRAGNWIEDYFILEDVKVEKVTEEVEIEGATRLDSIKSGAFNVGCNWFIQYHGWPYGDVVCSNVTESSITASVPEDPTSSFYPWDVQIQRKNIILNPGETYFVSADWDKGFDIWNQTDGYTEVVQNISRGKMYFTNSSNSQKEYFLNFFLDIGCINTISNFKETILSPTPIWKDWSYLFVGEDDSFEALSVSNNGISFNIEDDFDLCAVDLTLDLEVGKEYVVNFDITGPNSEICTIIKGNNYISRNYDYIYENDPVNCSIYVSLSDMNYTGKCVLSFHPQVPGTYTISNIRITEESLGGELVTPGENVSDGNNSTDWVPPSDSGSTSEIVLFEGHGLNYDGTDTIGDKMTNIKVGDKVYFTLTANGKQECQFIKKYWVDGGGLGTGIISIYDAETDVDVTFYAADIAEGSPADRPAVILDSGDEDSTTKTFYFIVTDAFMELKDIVTVVGSATIVKMWY